MGSVAKKRDGQAQHFSKNEQKHYFSFSFFILYKACEFFYKHPTTHYYSFTCGVSIGNAIESIGHIEADVT